MSSFSAGQRIVASWLGGAWEPATVIELGAGGMLKVRFDDGREVFLASMNARAAPAGTPASAPGAASNGLPPQPPPPDGFHPIAPGGQASAPAIPPTMAQPVAPTMPAQNAFPAQPPPVSPVAPTMPVQAVNPVTAAPVSPAAPAAPSPDAPPGEFKPIQGAPLDGAGGAMPPAFNPFEPGGGNKNG